MRFAIVAEQVDQRLVRLESLRRKARQRAAEIGAVEFRVFVDLAGQEALAKRAIRHEADPEFLERGYHFLLRLPPPQRVFALQRGERLDGVRAANRLHACLGKSEVLDLPGLNQFLHRAGHVFDGHVRVDAMLIQQVDAFHPEPLERAFDGLLDVLRPAVHARRSRPMIAAAQIEPELRGDHHFAAEGRQRLAHELFVDERAVDLGGVEERDAAFHGGVEKRDHLLLVFGRTVGKAHSHAAEPDSRNFQIALSKFALLHCFPLRTRSYTSRLGSNTVEAPARSFKFMVVPRSVGRIRGAARACAGTQGIISVA